MYFPGPDRPFLFPFSEGSIMSCVPLFPADLQLSCVLGFISRAREGVTVSLVKEALWISGCMMEKFVPSDQPTIQGVYADLDEALANLEQTVESLQSEVGVLDTTRDWTVLIPIFIEIARLIMDKYFQKPKVATE